MTEFIRTHSLQISAFLRQLMYLGLALEIFNLTEAQEGIILSTISAFLDLFTSKQTIATTKVDSIVDKGIERAVKVEMMKENGKHQ